MLLRGMMSFASCHKVSAKGNNSQSPAWCYNDMNSSCLQNMSEDDVAVEVLDGMERGEGA